MLFCIHLITIIDSKNDFEGKGKNPRNTEDSSQLGTVLYIVNCG